jgi:acyl carrier protein
VTVSAARTDQGDQDVPVDEVKEVLVSTLQIEDRADAMDASTPLFGELPELDSMSVVELVGALQEHFDIAIEDDEITGELFETLGSLAAFVADKRG